MLFLGTCFINLIASCHLLATKSQSSLDSADWAIVAALAAASVASTKVSFLSDADGDADGDGALDFTAEGGGALAADGVGDGEVDAAGGSSLEHPAVSANRVKASAAVKNEDFTIALCYRSIKPKDLRSSIIERWKPAGLFDFLNECRTVE